MICISTWQHTVPPVRSHDSELYRVKRLCSLSKSFQRGVTVSHNTAWITGLASNLPGSCFCLRRNQHGAAPDLQTITGTAGWDVLQRLQISADGRAAGGRRGGESFYAFSLLCTWCWINYHHNHTHVRLSSGIAQLNFSCVVVCHWSGKQQKCH